MAADPDRSALADGSAPTVAESVGETSPELAATAVSGGTILPSRHDIGPGTQVERFVVEKRLGAGAMGVVYQARDPELDRSVALKLIRGGSVIGGLRARLYREAQALARVAHPNVVVVHEVGTHDDQVFVAMELVRGGTLRSWLQTPRSQKEILHVLIDAGRGLAAAHAAELVHRDFKPDNVLIGDDRRVRVTDFGLARAKGDSVSPGEIPPSGEHARTGTPITTPLDEPLTQTGMMVGTPVYASPEQLEGGRVGAASDQFSFCITAYEALYGKRPFEASNLAELTERVTTGTIAPPPAGKRVDKRVHRALLRGLSPKPEDRFPSMDALLAQLVVAERRRAAWIIAGIATAVAAGAIIFVATRGASGGATCNDEAAAVNNLWNPQVSQRLHDNFTATGSKYADRLHASIDKLYSRYAASWSAARRDACLADPQAPATKQLVACLDDRYTKLRDHLAHAVVEPKLAHIPRLANLLDPIELCTHPPVGITSLLEARKQMLLGQSAWLQGQHERGHRHLQQLLVNVEAMGYAPFTVELLVMMAGLASNDQDNARAETLLRKALVIAESAADDRSKATVATKLAELLATRNQMAEAAHLLEQADATLAHYGFDFNLEADVLVARAKLALAENRYTDLEKLVAQAGELYRAGDMTDMGATSVLVQMYVKQGKTSEAEALLAKTLKDVGGDPPAKDGDAKPSKTSQTIALQIGCRSPSSSAEIDGMVERCAAALQRHEDEQGVGALVSAQPHDNLALSYEMQWEWARAREHYLRAAKIYETFRMTEQLPHSLNNAARMAFELEDYATALAENERAIQIAKDLDKPNDEEVVWARVYRGRSLVAVGRYDEAIADLDWAIKRLEVMPTPLPNAIGAAKLALASALWQRKGSTDRTQARLLVTTSRDSVKAFRATIDGDTQFNPTLRKSSDRLLVRLEAWLAKHR